MTGSVAQLTETATLKHSNRRTLAHRKHYLGDAYCLIVPATLLIHVRLVGNLFLPEVLLAITLPVLIASAQHRGVRRVSTTFVLLVSLWLVGQILADIYAESSFTNYARGWANIAFFLSNVVVLSLLVGQRWQRVTLIATGLVAGEILQFLVDPSVLAQAEPWKFGLGPPLTLAAAMIVSRPAVFRHRWIPVCVMLAFAFINLRLGFRALAGASFLTALYVVVLAQRAGRGHTRERHAFLRLLLVASVAVIGGGGFIIGYTYAASSGLLGNTVQHKYLAQRSSYGILVSGRPSVLVDLHAISDSPIFGHGSWASDDKYAKIMREELSEAGYHEAIAPNSQGLIESHSQLLGAWVSAGIMGPFFWLWVLGLIATVLRRGQQLPSHRIPFVVLIASWTAWNIFFSPFAGEARLFVALCVVVLLMARRDVLSQGGRIYR